MATLPKRELRIAGFKLLKVKGEFFPIMMKSADPHDSVVGEIRVGLTEQDISRLAYFEGEEYLIEELEHEGSLYRYFAPTPGILEAHGDWDFHDWRSNEERYQNYLTLTHEYMKGYDQKHKVKWNGS